MDYQGRQQRLQNSLSVHRLEALLVTHTPGIRYLCGFTGSAGVLVITGKGRALFTDGRYTAQARAEVEGAKIVIARKGLLEAAAAWLSANIKNGRRASRTRIGIEAEHVTVAARSRLAGVLPSGFLLREAPALIEQARMVKDEEEIACLRSAVILGSTLFDRALETIRPGVRETEVAAEMEYAARHAGAEAMSFETIIASGKRSALPHGRASQSAIPAQGFVVCDFGVILSGYCSDMTRTVYVGCPSAEARGVYQAVQQAQQAAVDAVRPGISVAEVDCAARKSLQKSGLAKYFTHSTGHGVGLEIHEAPRVAAGQCEVLQPGMVITIEPGVYVPGKWGVRIEDMVVVTEHGCQVLTPTSKELVAI
ncbi:MAG: M24 family metallopeptidase [Terriglobales bacterium]